MKPLKNNYVFIGIALILGMTVSCTKESKTDVSKESAVHKEHKESFYYTCSMHPKIRENKPGKCPICHMNLTKIIIDTEEEIIKSSEKSQTDNTTEDMWRCEKFPDVTAPVSQACPIDGTPMIMVMGDSPAKKIIAKVKLRKAQLSHFKPAYFPVTKMIMTKNIRLLGTVLQSEEKESKIPARIGGRVEKVYVKSTGSMIKKGDPVIDIYSPRLITAGEEYLIAKRSLAKSQTAEYKEMLEQIIERLKLWGIKSFQYESWYRKGKVPRSITLYSPATGIVRKRNAIVGKYFKEGQNFFELSDLSDVWVEMDVYEQDSALVSIGQKINLQFTSIPGEVTEGAVDFVAPVLDLKSRTLKIRTTIQNISGKIKPGMVADGTLSIQLEGEPLVIPRTAIIDTGKRKIIWTKINEKTFQAKEIRTGYESGGYVEVKHGLVENENVVIEGNFLLDAQAQLSGGYQTFNDKKNNQPAAHNH